MVLMNCQMKEVEASISLTVIPAKAGLWRQEARTNIRQANGPKGVLQKQRVIQSHSRNGMCFS
jgi:hypothetical protein